MKIFRGVRKIVDYTYELEIDEQFIEELNGYLIRDTRNVKFPKVNEKDIAMHIAGVWDRADEEIIVYNFNSDLEKTTLGDYLTEYLDNSLFYDGERFVEDEQSFSFDDMDVEFSVKDTKIKDAVIAAIKEV